MPEKDGFQTSLEIAAFLDGVNLPDNRTVIVACSAFTTAEFIEKSKLYRMRDYIIKPVKVELLKNALMEYVFPIFTSKGLKDQIKQSESNLVI